MTYNERKELPGSSPAFINTQVAPPVLGLLKDSISAITTRTMSNDPSVILLDHTLQEKFEGRKNARVIDCRLYKHLPDHRVCF
jgi:hypothetical protein